MYYFHEKEEIHILIERGQLGQETHTLCAGSVLSKVSQGEDGA